MFLNDPSRRHRFPAARARLCDAPPSLATWPSATLPRGSRYCVGITFLSHHPPGPHRKLRIEVITAFWWLSWRLGHAGGMSFVCTELGTLGASDTASTRRGCSASAAAAVAALGARSAASRRLFKRAHHQHVIQTHLTNKHISAPLSRSVLAFTTHTIIIIQ